MQDVKFVRFITPQGKAQNKIKGILIDILANIPIIDRLSNRYFRFR